MSADAARRAGIVLVAVVLLLTVPHIDIVADVQRCRGESEALTETATGVVLKDALVRPLGGEQLQRTIPFLQTGLK